MTWIGGGSATYDWYNYADFGTERKFSAGSTIYAQHEPHSNFYFIVEGSALATVYSEGGPMLTVEIMGPGALFGEAPAICNEERLVTVEAHTDCVLVSYSSKETLEAITVNPELALIIIRVMAQKQRSLLEKTFVSAHRTHESSILALFKRFMDADQLRIELTHQQIGDIIGASRLTVTRRLAILKEAGLIMTEREKVTILDPDGLAHLAEQAIS